MTSCNEELLAQGAAILAGHPDLSYVWEHKEASAALTFAATKPTGFQVRLEASRQHIFLCAGNMHLHFDEPGHASDCVRQALGLARDLLTPAMRLREVRVLGFPYRWYLEYNDGGTWKMEQAMGLLFWLPRILASEVIYQNDQLPAREGLPSAGSHATC